jgi:hypothetical protein
MKASVRFVEGITVVDVSGCIKLGERSSILRDIVKDCWGKVRSKFSSISATTATLTAQASANGSRLSPQYVTRAGKCNYSK